MFTGLISRTARVKANQKGLLQIEPPREPWPDALQLGESIAINGCCLTLVDATGGMSFDLSEETLSRTTLGSLETESVVNLERAMRIGDRLGGHLVQGHVDAVGLFNSVVELEGSHVITFFAPEPWNRFLIDKGSVAINGISLTVISPHKIEDSSNFDVAIIPATWKDTNLSLIQPGEPVNLEFDLIGKYVENLVKPYQR